MSAHDGRGGHDDAGYVHGTAATEQDRLARLNALLNARSLDALALAGGERVLDLGAGLGQMAHGMIARGASRVVGVERSAAQIARARDLARHATPEQDEAFDLRPGNVLAPPLAGDEWGTFDVAHARFLLEHVTDPLAVVQVMVRAVRPGGRIVLEDDDHAVLRLWPEPPGFDRIWKAYERTYERLGCDPYIGRRLVALLHEAGARPVKNRWLWFGACAGGGDEDLQALAINIREILRGAEDAIRSAGEIDRMTFEAALEALDRWRGRPDASIWYASAWAEGVRPA
jgi:SAM-dependent methyltransferase